MFLGLGAELRERNLHRPHLGIQGQGQAIVLAAIAQCFQCDTGRQGIQARSAVFLVHRQAVGSYHLLGRTRDDAAGEAFDKVAKMLGLPYPGGPEIDQHALSGDRKKFAFPRSMLDSGDFTFSFSGLKTAVLYQLDKLDGTLAGNLDDLCASFQEAVVDVLVKKTIKAARKFNVKLVTVSGGVSCNRRLRAAITDACQHEGLEVVIATPSLSTDNAAMIAFVALHRHLAGLSDPLERDVDPNLSLAFR